MLRRVGFLFSLGTLVTLEESAACVLALFADVSVPAVTGINELSLDERLQLGIMSCANMITHMLVSQTHHNRMAALQGLGALYFDMQKTVERLCAMWEAPEGGVQ
jgi:hypothetical protein